MSLHLNSLSKLTPHTPCQRFNSLNLRFGYAPGKHADRPTSRQNDDANVCRRGNIVIKL